MIFGLENNQMSQNQQLSSIQSNHNYIHQTLPLFSTNYPPQTNLSQNFGHQLQFNQQLKPFQLKFNLSPNSLQCFIAKPKAQKFKSLSARLAKQSKSEATLKTFKLQLNKFNPRNDNQQIKSQTQRLNVEQNTLVNQDEDQLSTILSNQIIHQIEKNGIRYNWKDKQTNKQQLNIQQKQRDQEIEQLFNAFSDNKYAKKSFRQNFSTDQSIVTQNSNNQNQQTCEPQPNLNNYSTYQGFQYNVHPIYQQQFLQKSFQKNYSMASTTQPYASIYYQQINAYQMQQMSTIMSNHHYNGLKSLPSILFPSGQFIIRPQGLGKDPRTTLMIKNIPNKYTIQYLSQEIDQQFSNYYDFLYLPCDTKSGANQGYGFINFIDLQAIKRFYQMFHGKKWRRFRSQKICNLTYARLQGINSLIEHFQNSKVLNHKEKKYQPIIKKLNKQIHILIKEQQEQQGLMEQ